MRGGETWLETLCLDDLWAVDLILDVCCVAEAVIWQRKDSMFGQISSLV